jgi:hypothetical protein
MEEPVAQLNRAMDGLREEIQLRAAQHARAQSLMNSMRDQASEMASPESVARAWKNLEELADVHRPLSERSRKGPRRDSEAVAERY